jgi:hypothetical protein
MNQKTDNEKPCLDCAGLINGTRSNQSPHGYLVHSGNTDSTFSTYKCLICSSELMRRTGEQPAHWVVKP